MKYLQISVFLLFLTSCLEEQLNPLKESVINSCFDGVLNQNEEDIDCGGVCEACAEPIVSPCASTLSENKVTNQVSIPDIEFTNILCDEVYYGGQYEIEGVSFAGSVRIYFGEDSLPVEDKVYKLRSSVSNDDSGKAYLKINFSNYGTFHSGSGDLYVTFKDNKAIAEFCEITVRNSNLTEILVSGKVMCE